MKPLNSEIAPVTPQWKGNLHAHSRRSDGNLPVEDVVRLYREAGYNFFGLSDHERYYGGTEFDTSTFILYPAIEYAVSNPKDGWKGHHMHGIHGGEVQPDHDPSLLDSETVWTKFKWRSPRTVQKAIDRLRSVGLLVMYNHPEWSRLELEDIMTVEGLWGLEIYNHGSEVTEGTGLSVTLWDQLLRRGYRLFGVATDDNHNGDEPGTLYADSFGGWICVSAPELSREGLAAALRAGHFYSSSGPQIHRYEVEGDYLHVSCSAVQTIRFVSYERRGRVLRAAEGETLTDARFHIAGDEVFVRVECTDARGKVAWANPIFVDDLS